MKIEIQKAENSKLKELSFEKLAFGKIFTDHMLLSNYKDGQWLPPVIKPYGNIAIPPSAQALHYGQAVFEGMKAYRNKTNEVFLFRPEDNFIRFNKSCRRLCMPEIPKSIFIDGLETLVDLDRGWIPNHQGASLYLRPFMFAAEDTLKAIPAQIYTFMIICSPAQSYYNHPLKVKIADHYSRAASGGVGFCKAAGNYAAAFFPTFIEAQKEGYDQILWTDAATHLFIEESGTMNVFISYEDKLVTPPVTETILNGVIRRSIITLAKEIRLKVEERPIAVKEVVEGLKSGKIKEVFGCGTAAVIIRYRAVGYGTQMMNIELLKEEKSIALKIKKRLIGIQTGTQKDPFGWRKKIPSTFIQDE